MLINKASDPDRAESAYLAKLLDMFDNGMSQKWLLLILLGHVL